MNDLIKIRLCQSRVISALVFGLKRVNCINWIYVLIFVFSVGPSVSMAGNQCRNFYSNAKKQLLPIKTLYAVHITRKYPRDGVIRMSRNAAIGRLTLHFTLGHMVTPHFGGNWEDMPMGILVPAISLKPQLVNLKAEDTFILGDFKIPEGSVLVIREDLDVEPDFPAVVVRFPKNEKIRKTIDRLLDNAEQNYQDTPDYWKSIRLADDFHSFKLHSETLYETLEDILTSYLSPFYKNISQDIFLVDLSSDISKAKDALFKINSLLQQRKLSEVAIESIKEQIRKATSAINVLEAENRLLTEYHKTIRPLIPSHGEKILELSQNPEDLWKFILNHLEEWPIERQFR